MNHVFLVGPSCVGKTSVGELAASELDLPFLDQDDLVHSSHGNIPQFVQTHGYYEYARLNAVVAEEAIGEAASDVVMAASAGYLVHEGCDDVVERNLAFVRRVGIAILLTPSLDLDAAADVIIARHIKRYETPYPLTWREHGKARLRDYLKVADAVLVADGDPPAVAQAVVKNLSETPMSRAGRNIL